MAAPIHPPRPTRPDDPVKRIFDVLLGSLLLLLTAPLMAVVAVAVRVALGRPVLFRQCRIGLDERPFELVKFRTMREPRGGLVSDGDRLTPFGRWLRSTSLDELPTLWNVLRGEMSLVGPRPLLPQYLDRYSPEQARRHDVRPGVTGLAQVRGRNRLTWDDRLALDVEYVDRQTFRLDLSILVATIGATLLRKGITAEGHPTAPEFLGSQR